MTRQASKTRQQTAVGEGLALGCLLNGVTGVTTSTMDVNAAFRYAWNGWPSATRFPAVQATFTRNDVRSILVKSPRRMDAPAAQWNHAGTLYEPVSCRDTVQEAGEDLVQTYGVPLAAWRQLASAFLKDLGENKVRRADPDDGQPSTST